MKISPELEAKLDSLTTQQGRARETLVREAVEQFVQHTEWFTSKELILPSLPYIVVYQVACEIDVAPGWAQVWPDESK